MTGRPLHLALYDGDFKVVQLLEYEATMDARTELVSESGQLEVVRALFDYRADVDIEGGFDEIRLLRWDITTYDRCWIMMPKYNKSVLKV